MKKLNHEDVMGYVEQNIGDFHQQRIRGVKNLKLMTVLQRKNPYLFRAKNILTADQIIRSLLDAHISSNEETIFGDWLEGLAIFINHEVYGGRKSGIRGIDLEFENDDKKYIVAIKSGPNWGNSSQVAKLRSDFIAAKKTLRTSGSKLDVVAVNGCCYGKQRNPDRGDYFKYCGQQFWKFISGDAQLFVDIIEPLGYRAKEKNDAFARAYAQVVNTFVKQFMDTLCTEHGDIDWDELVRLNSADE